MLNEQKWKDYAKYVALVTMRSWKWGQVSERGGRSITIIKKRRKSACCWKTKAHSKSLIED
jgi:hypothetical protein